MVNHNIKLTLEYDGTNFHGWQRQANLPTVQETLEDALTRITRQPIRVTAAGRTDAGVHALAQAANFKTTLQLKESSWVKAINSMLPDDIVVKSAEYVPMEFHARYSAKSKVYQYIILNSEQPSTFLRNYVWHIKQPLDIQAMKDAAGYLTGTHDFSSFRASECGAKSAVRTLDRLEITVAPYPLPQEGWFLPTLNIVGVGEALASPVSWATKVAPTQPPELSVCKYQPQGKGVNSKVVLFTFEARSYLQHMVRNIVGTLAETGKGKLKPSDVKAILEKKDRRCAGPAAPPYGLFLMEIRY